mgnify:CR=1 FL=1
MYKIYLSILTLILSGCFSINPSTVQLSERVGVQLAEMETLHILTVQRYFDGEREKIKHFLTNTWEPLFLKNFLGTSNVLSMLQNVSTFEDTTRENITEGLKLYLNDPTESEAAAKTILDNLNISRQGEQEAVRSVLNDYVEDDRLEAATVHISSLLGSDNAAQIILEFAEAAHEEMQAQREALLAPLEAKRETVIAELSGAYSVLVRGQSTITGRLDAASKRTGDRDFLMDKLGVGKTPDLIMQQLSGISTQVDKALSGANRVLNKGEGDPIKGVIDILKADLESMNEKEEEQEMDDKN